ncbi:MAG TPA: M12 family metallo-peptidase [Verrucomicrobiae bacterium]|jgi:hypothetical protein
MTRILQKIVLIFVTASFALSTYKTLAEEVRPSSLTIDGKKYQVIYRPGSEKKNRAIVTLDSGDEVVGEGFLLFRNGHTVGTANVNDKHFRFVLTPKGDTIAEVPRAPKEPANRPDSIQAPSDGPALNVEQLRKLVAEKTQIRNDELVRKTKALKAVVPGGSTDQVVVLPPPTSTGPVNITIMVLYDQSAVTSLIPYRTYPGMESITDTIEMSVAEANEAYINCGINAHLTIVYTGLIDFTESGDLTTDLRVLAYDTNVATLRTQYAADVVTLMEGPTDQTYSGMGYIITGTSKLAFNVVEAVYSVNDYVLAHEVGHNLGCAHDLANAASPGAFPYSYGYNFGPPSATTPGELAYGTIMCYPGARSGLFSTPSNTYMGYLTGTVSNNNAETISERAPWVAMMMPQPTYTVSMNITGVGSVTQSNTSTLNAAGFSTNPPPCLVERGQPITLTANGNFLCWTGATNTTSTNITIYPDQDTNVTANFVGVQSLAPLIGVQPHSTSVTRGDTLTLVTSGVGVPAPDYQWQMNGTNIATGSALTIPNMSVAKQGAYRCVLSNSSGSVTSLVVAVSVTAPVKVTQPQIMSLTPNSDGSMGLLYYGVTGKSYVVQTSTDLAHWTPVSTNTATGVMNSFVDTDIQNGNRYYRLKVAQ